MKLKIPGHEIEIDKDDKEFLSKFSKTDIAGLLGGDWIKYWRWNNLLKILQKVKQKAKENNLEPNEITPKFLQGFFENASLEENQTIQEMWASLLLSKSVDKDVNYFYINVLKELEPVDAKVLYLLFSTGDKKIDTEFNGNKVAKAVDITINELDVIIEKLYSFNLLKPGKFRMIRAGDTSPPSDTTKIFRFSDLGLDFCKKCIGTLT
jgi:hypothetical protein